MKQGYVEGSSIFNILHTRKANNNSSTGARGVSQNKHGRFIAQICFKRKTYYLGSFATLEEAIEARKKGEDKFFTPLISAYESAIDKESIRKRIVEELGEK